MRREEFGNLPPTLSVYKAMRRLSHRASQRRDSNNVNTEIVQRKDPCEKTRFVIYIVVRFRAGCPRVSVAPCVFFLPSYRRDYWRILPQRQALDPAVLALEVSSPSYLYADCLLAKLNLSQSVRDGA